MVYQVWHAGLLVSEIWNTPWLWVHRIQVERLFERVGTAFAYARVCTKSRALIGRQPTNKTLSQISLDISKRHNPFISSNKLALKIWTSSIHKYKNPDILYKNNAFRKDVFKNPEVQKRFGHLSNQICRFPKASSCQKNRKFQKNPEVQKNQEFQPKRSVGSQKILML